MKTAFIDTSIISECHRQSITAKALLIKEVKQSSHLSEANLYE